MISVLGHGVRLKRQGHFGHALFDSIIYICTLGRVRGKSNTIWQLLCATFNDNMIESEFWCFESHVSPFHSLLNISPFELVKHESLSQKKISNLMPLEIVTDSEGFTRDEIHANSTGLLFSSRNKENY